MLAESAKGRTITVTVSICNSIPDLDLNVNIASSDGTLSPSPVSVSTCTFSDGLLYNCTVEIEAQSFGTPYTLTVSLSVNMMMVGSQISREITTDPDCMLRLPQQLKLITITFMHTAFCKRQAFVCIGIPILGVVVIVGVAVAVVVIVLIIIKKKKGLYCFACHTCDQE